MLEALGVFQEIFFVLVHPFEEPQVVNLRHDEEDFHEAVPHNALGKVIAERREVHVLGVERQASFVGLLQVGFHPRLVVHYIRNEVLQDYRDCADRSADDDNSVALVRHVRHVLQFLDVGVDLLTVVLLF